MSQPTKLHTFPTLYGKSSTGSTKIWNATVYEYADGTAKAVITFGKYDGKQQEVVRDYAIGKNLGKKNATSAYEQCYSETHRKWLDKRDKENYLETVATANLKEPVANLKEPVDSRLQDTNSKINSTESIVQTRPVYPMLAQTYVPSAAKKRNDIIYPCYVQPKLDGLRCVVRMVVTSGNLSVVFQSRTGGHFTSLSHLEASVRSLYESAHESVQCFDGELYTDEYPFEELAGLIKKQKITDDDRVKLARVCYHIYDYVPVTSHIATTPFEVRADILRTLSEKSPIQSIRFVETRKISTQEEFRAYFNQFIERGYEGIMLRNRGGLYRENYRSPDLQKYKEFCEDEFPIVDFKEGEGRDAGTVIWVCRTKEGNNFSVRPRGTVETRRRLYEDALHHRKYPKMLTVIYQELSEMGVPRFPVGKALRDGY